MLQEDSSDDKLPMTGRLTPIGGASSDTEYGKSANEEFYEKVELLEEHERLNASLSALTRHFAHVQLRLQQVVSAPTAEDRENLLIELHEFASSGIPDVMCRSSMYTNDRTNEELIENEKLREKEFISELKQKLDELERYAAASGSLEGVPTSVTMEKQRVLIDQLRTKLDLQLDDASVSKLSAEELRKLVDQAIHQLTNPVKLKENLITQMRTQINDLEKFIEFLKADSAAAAATSLPPTLNDKKSSESSKSTPTKSNPTTTASPLKMRQPTSKLSSDSQANFSQTMKKVLILTQLYTFLLLTCGTRSMQKKANQPAPTMKKDVVAKKHYGDLLAKLEVAIEKVINVVRSANAYARHSHTYLNNDNDDNSSSITTSDNEEEDYDQNIVVLAVRQDLIPALRELIEHGLYETNYSTSLAVWGCFSTRANYATANDTMHAWKLFLKYYEMKHGNEFANSPARKLSESFSLDVIGGKPITLKQCLLSGIDNIVKLHEKHNKSMDSCFKSFVCFALNEKKLVSFLRIILKTMPLVENYYQPWSYTKKTGFNDALHSLDRLKSIDFRLPINISVRRFMNNKDLIE
ncbi:unnamed protein product [Rotaria socialis]|uniref:RUN domain-containing protein n=1 Tax=Rotaria socialis TaxID=392032 RepID=A0A818M9P1_9BILA|nr:unnamed protein product [Rotaria socialis]CAF3539267.1 unnamed protein product [Rotaria socialis]CAF3581917.1 unnamed protein product [Rotaria socialis]CAF3624206.1 unnamed protein product [Rotaria socialis]CAF3765484.1 unnamed protein product [Rotaria socialis]